MGLVLEDGHVERVLQPAPTHRERLLQSRSSSRVASGGAALIYAFAQAGIPLRYALLPGVFSGNKFFYTLTQIGIVLVIVCSHRFHAQSRYEFSPAVFSPPKLCTD